MLHINFLPTDDKLFCASLPITVTKMLTFALWRPFAKSTRSDSWRWTPTRPSGSGPVSARLTRRARLARSSAARALWSKTTAQWILRLRASLKITSRANKAEGAGWMGFDYPCVRKIWGKSNGMNAKYWRDVHYETLSCSTECKVKNNIYIK